MKGKVCFVITILTLVLWVTSAFGCSIRRTVSARRSPFLCHGRISCASPAHPKTSAFSTHAMTIPGKCRLCMGTSLNTAPQLLSAFTLGEDVRVKQAFLAENGYVLLLREDNSERLVLLGDDAIFYSSLQELACRLFPVQGSEPGGFP